MLEEGTAVKVGGLQRKQSAWGKPSVVEVCILGLLVCPIQQGISQAFPWWPLGQALRSNQNGCSVFGEKRNDRLARAVPGSVRI